MHVNALQLCTRNELNFISLVTHFHFVKEVRIHTFHLNHYLTSRRAHVRLQSVRWELVKLILHFIERGPWVLQESKKEREIRVTFDEFLKPVIEAWRVGQPYAHLVHEISEYETNIISTYSKFGWIHRGVSAFAEGYSLDSEFEVDFVHEALDSNSEEEYDIMRVNVYPFFLVSL